MEVADWVAILGILATVLVSVVSLALARTRERNQQERDDRLRQEERERDDAIRKELIARERALLDLERAHKPHVEFDIECDFFGPENDEYLAVFLLVARNRGKVIQEFPGIGLRVRGIERPEGRTDGAKLGYLEGMRPRLAFPKVVIDENNIVPEGVTYFVEPNVRQVFTYVTKVPASLKYVVTKAVFHYVKDRRHSSERVFEVRASHGAGPA